MVGKRTKGRAAQATICFGLLGLILCLASCGSAETPARSVAITPPAVPTPGDCGIGTTAGAGHTRSAGKARRRPPPPGDYLYRTRGRLGVPQEAVRAADVPNLTKAIITRPVDISHLVCFRIQKRYTPEIANTETYVIRGDELFLVGLRIQALGRSREVRPDPAVLFANESGSKWSGQFSGATSGSYSATGLGKRHLRFDGKTISVTGLKSSVSYRGAVGGSQVTTTWIWPKRRLIVDEEVKLREKIGVNEVRMRLHRDLTESSDHRKAS